METKRNANGHTAIKHIKFAQKKKNLHKEICNEIALLMRNTTHRSATKTIKLN